MYSFYNDYSEGAHPRILEALSKANLEQNTGYGEDIHCRRAAEQIKRLINREDADIHFIPGGTQANMLVISSALRPHECVISADTGHINVHETGAIEYTGHKVAALPCKDGKLSPDDIIKALDYHCDEHMVKPKMVYISNSTELGTVYTKTELEAIRKLCLDKELYLFLDGARLGAALVSGANDMTIEDIASLADVFYIGGTKNGALLGEALVICNNGLKKDFRYMIKQKGAMLAKGFIIGIQFEELFKDDLYFRLARHADSMAGRIAKAFLRQGYGFYATPCTNQLFPILPDRVLSELSKEFGFQIQRREEDESTVIRLVTSWATTDESVDRLCELITRL
jgi:threonine aldolase